MPTPQYIHDLLRQVPDFGALSDEELVELTAASRIVTFNEGDEIISKGNGSEHAYVLVSGVLNHQASGLGRVYIGTLFGEIGVFDGAEVHLRLDTLIANSEVQVIEIPFTALRQFSQLLPAFYVRVVRYLRDRVEAAQSRHTSERSALHANRRLADGSGPTG